MFNLIVFFKMKKRLLYISTFVLAVFAFMACSDDDEDNSWTKIPSVEIKGENVVMTVNGQPSNGSIQLFSSSAESGELKLINVVNGLESVSVDVVLVKKPDNSFDFSGEKTVDGTKAAISAVTTTVKVKGNITPEGTATSEVITEMAGGLTGNWIVADTVLVYEYAVAHSPLYFTWMSPGHYVNGEGSELTSVMITTMVQLVAPSLLSDVLHQVNFAADGNITAKYYSGTDYSMDWIMGHLGQVVPSKGKAWINSPSNLANWYMKGDKLYVIPNVGNIIAQIMKDGNNEGGSSIDFSAILELVKGMSGKEIKGLLSKFLPEDFPLDLNQLSDAKVEEIVGWLSTGIPLSYTSSEVTLENGKELTNLRVYLTKDFLDPLMPMLFPLLPKLDKMMQESAPDLYPMLTMFTGLESLMDIERVWKDTNKFELGIELADQAFQ